MNLCEFFKKEYIIGLDVGASSIKLAQFREGADGLRLAKTAIKEIKPSGGGASLEKDIVPALKDLFRDIDLKKSKIIATLNCPQTSVNKIIAPYMPRIELQAGMKLQAKNYFPFPVEEAYLDFEILGEVVENGIRKYEIAVAASPKKTVNNHLNLLEKAGIRPVAFVPVAYALQNSSGHAHVSGPEAPASGQKDSRLRCLIDIGASHTELIILKGRHLVFSRKIPVAGGDFTKAMTGALVSDRGKTQLSPEEAEKIKLSTGIPAGGEAKIIEGKISTAQVIALLRMPLEQLITEVGRSFDYYRESSGGARVDSVVLFGGGAFLSGLVKSLAEGLGLEVSMGDSLAGLNLSREAAGRREEIAPRLELAIGAALTAGKGINLLPPEVRDLARKILKRSIIEAVIAAVALISVFIYIGMKIQLGNLEKRIAVATFEFSSLQAGLNQAGRK